MYRREGRYELALRHFSAAIDEYSRRDPEHRNLARSLANMGYVERLIALRLRKRIDADAAQRRKSEADLRREYEAGALRRWTIWTGQPAFIASTPIIGEPARFVSIGAIFTSTAATCTVRKRKRARPTRSARRSTTTS